MLVSFRRDRRELPDADLLVQQSQEKQLLAPLFVLLVSSRRDPLAIIPAPSADLLDGTESVAAPSIVFDPCADDVYAGTDCGRCSACELGVLLFYYELDVVPVCWLFSGC